jgi:hypothetical protein
MPRRERTFTEPDAPARDLDWSDPLTLRAAAKIELAQRAAQTRYATDPWAFLVDCVWTLDQITGQTRRFPDKPYLAFLTALWSATLDGPHVTLPASTEPYFRPPYLVDPVPDHIRFGPIEPDAPIAWPLQAWPKSRRLVLTWLGTSLNYWLARYRAGCKIGIFAQKQGEKETQGSNELIWRVKFVHDHLPALLGAREIDYSTGRFSFVDTRSELLALAQGRDQARQFTFTSAFCDEMAFWEEALETYTGLRPTAEGGGRITCCSSANPGAFKQICFDKLGRRAA